MAIVSITSCYRFQALDQLRLESLRQQVHAFAAPHSLHGLFLLAKEGFNATLCGPEEGIAEFKRWMQGQFGPPKIIFKDSHSPRPVFRRLSVQVRDEIVTLGDACPIDFDPVRDPALAHFLTPDEWEEWLTARNDYVLVDVRNWYETSLGTFEGAIDPKLSNFGNLPQFLDRVNFDRNKPILMYCTGGVRCEKAARLMHDAGFSELYQLEGGILNYLASHPRSKFKGECFVFDRRVAVDQDLAPSARYTLCPHCGNPATERVTCRNCGEPTQVCVPCSAQEVLISCSKNCAHHLGRRSISKIGPGKMSPASCGAREMPQRKTD